MDEIYVREYDVEILLFDKRHLAIEKVVIYIRQILGLVVKSSTIDKFIE